MAAATIASLLIGSRRRRAALVGVRCQGGGGTGSPGELVVPIAPVSPVRLGSLVIGRRFSLARHGLQLRSPTNSVLLWNAG